MTTEVQPQRSAKEQFDKQASHYNAQWNAWSKETLDWLIEHSEVGKSESVLDIATGTGFTALAFAPLAERVVAVDVSTGMLDEARRRAEQSGVKNVEFKESGAESLPFPDGSFDIVVCRIAAHHFVDIAAFSQEAARVLASGGRLLTADTTVPDDFPEAADWQNEVEAVRDPSHVRSYTPKQWSELLENAGLRVQEITTAGSGITIPLADWMVKAGCTPDQEREVRNLFENAPQSARDAFQIDPAGANGDVLFTWQRVVIKAVKAGDGFAGARAL